MPPADRPELVEALAAEVERIAEPELVDDVFELLVDGIATVGKTGAAAVDVTSIVCCAWVMPAASVAAGKTDVTICVVGGGTEDTGLLIEDVTT